MIFSAATFALASTLLASTAFARTRTYDANLKIQSAASAGECPITYHGSSLLTKSLNLYYIYYGTWTPIQKTILQDFANNLQSSSWWGMTKQYYQITNGQKIHVDGRIKLAGTFNDTVYTLSKATTEEQLPGYIQSLINTKRLPEDPNGLYVVLTSADVTHRSASGSSGFCKDYCGYHYYAPLNSGHFVPYMFVGNSMACLNGCVDKRNWSVSPNLDVGVDGLASVLAHEISEAATDPYMVPGFGGWYDCQGEENADKCAWDFGAVTALPNKSVYNTVIGKRKFLIQQNWNVVKQACALAP